METPQAQIAVYRSRNRAACIERALVLHALDIDYEIHAVDHEFLLLVDVADSDRASNELGEYNSEPPLKPKRPPEPVPVISDGVAGVIVYVTLLVAIGWIQTHDVGGLGWFQRGKIDAGLIMGGEWWRTVTALTLHLDIGHLSANLVFGAVFGVFASQMLGNGLAWFSILMSGVLGNVLNSWLHSPDHTAAGASTAIFGALGLFTSYVWRRRRSTDSRWPYRWAPVIAGVALLAYTGVGGERTDIGAHLAGFGCGVAIGAIYGVLGDRLPVGRDVQKITAALALGIIAAAWFAAL